MKNDIADIWDLFNYLDEEGKAKPFNYRGCKREREIDRISMTFGICQKCRLNMIRNIVYNYCPTCMNDYYKSLGLKEVKWVKKDGMIVGQD